MFFLLAKSFLNLTDRMADNMIFQGESANLTAPPLGFSMINVAPEEFSGLTFGASIVSPTKNPEVRGWKCSNEEGSEFGILEISLNYKS